ncbi:MAG: hypothetical protein U1A77_12185 [Pirellulales bacterium]
MNTGNSLTPTTDSSLAARRARRTRRKLRECLGGTALALVAAIWTGGTSELTQASDVRPTQTTPENPTVVGAGNGSDPASSPKVANKELVTPSDTSEPSEVADPSNSAATESVEQPADSSTESSANNSTKPRELSSQPLVDRPRVIIDRSKRPKWVEQPPVRTGDIHSSTVSSGPFATQRGALERLDEELQAGVSAYIEEYLESAAAGKQIVYSAKEIRQRLVKEPIYLEFGEFEGLGTMQDAHAQLVFDSTFRVELEERWRQVRTMARLFNFSVFAGAILLLLGGTRVALHGRGKKTDASTASLKLTTGTAILGVLGVSALIAAKLLLV